MMPLKTRGSKLGPTATPESARMFDSNITSAVLPSHLRPASFRVWEATELRCSILGYLKVAFGWKFKKQMAPLIILNKQTFLSVAAILYEDSVLYRKSVPLPMDFVDYLHSRGCPLPRLKLYTSFVKTMELTRRLPREKPLASINQARFLSLFPALQKISFTICVGSVDVPGHVDVEGYLRRENNEEGFTRLTLCTKNELSRGAKGFNIHSIYSGTVNTGSIDGKFQLEEVRFENLSFYCAGRDNGHTWFYKDLKDATCPLLQILALGNRAMSFSQIHDILRKTPNLIDLEVLVDANGLQPLEEPNLSIFGLCPQLRRLKLVDEDESWAQPIVQVLDTLVGSDNSVGICSELVVLDITAKLVAELPFGKFPVGDWMYVDGNPVAAPAQGAQFKPRWNLKSLRLRIGASHRQHVSPLALIYFFATYIPLHCGLTLRYSEYDVYEAAPDIDDEEEDCINAEGAEQEKWSSLIDASRKRMREQADGVSLRESKVGWKLLKSVRKGL